MERAIYLVTGVMASGKSTVSELLAGMLPKAVHLRGDVFRKMIVRGREEMADPPSEEAVRQLLLRYRMTADAAKSYYDAGFWVVMQDNYYGEMLPKVLSLLDGYPAHAAVLCPSPEAVGAREAARGKVGYGGYSVRPLYEAFMRETPRVGLWIDSTHLTADETARAIYDHFSEQQA